jgi:flavin-binding protein dodecin
MAGAVVAADRARAAVVEAGQRWAAGQYDLVRLVGELDESSEWAADGAVTCAQWVVDALDVEVCTAREWVRIRRALRELPAIAAAFEARRLSYSKVWP